MPFNEEFIQNVLALRGVEGQRWLERLPDVVRACEQRWSIRVGDPFQLNYNYAAPGVRADGTPVVLKISFPENPEFQPEVDALRLFEGRGIVALLAVDAEHDAMLLERVEPGQPLSALEDDEAATRIIISIMRQLWRPAPAEHQFPTTASWYESFQRLRQRFDGGTGPLPRDLVDAGEATGSELLGSITDPVLLHGDLHHGNVLSARRAPWLAIDPKGIIGDRAHEPAALLRNPYPHLLSRPAPRRLTARRLDQLSSELSLDRERIRRWAFAQTILSAVWRVVENSEGWEYDLAIVDLL